MCNIGLMLAFIEICIVWMCTCSHAIYNHLQEKNTPHDGVSNCAFILELCVVRNREVNVSGTGKKRKGS